MTDHFIYSGAIERGSDLDFIRLVDKEKSSDSCKVIMCSGGGSPDAAYKMARYLQHRYENFSVVVPGICKSAATLFAIGAKELIFCPYGELGPLDIQVEKKDQVTRQESGLNISEAINTLESRALNTFQETLLDQLRNTGGVVAFTTAAEIATGVVSALYGPIFAQISPEEVGSRSRAMRIGDSYARRLDVNQNLKPRALDMLNTTYPSHGFVIDFIEAGTLFNSVRLADSSELECVEQCGPHARFPSTTTEIRKITVDTTTQTDNLPESQDDTGTDASAENNEANESSSKTSRPIKRSQARKTKSESK